MRIRSCGCSPQHLLRCRDDVIALLRQPSDDEVRPCRGCDAVCPCARRSRSCCCQCSAQCPMAGGKLSSDGERYPIEPRVLPLVYALSVLRVVEPCWSCEGHADNGGEIKIPQVWFYSGSAIYPVLLQQYLSRLFHAGTLSTPWELAISPHQPEVAVTLFMLRPAHRSDFRLGPLQEDLHQIGTYLIAEMHTLAEELLCRLPAPD